MIFTVAYVFIEFFSNDIIAVPILLLFIIADVLLIEVSDSLV